MEPGRKSTPTASNEAWVETKPHWLTAPLQDVLDSTPKLSTEMRTLLFAISELLAVQGEQLKVVLQAQERQIMQVMEEVKYPSHGPQYVSQPNVDSVRSNTAEKPIWTSEAYLPHCLDNNKLVTLPAGEAPEMTPVQEIWEASTLDVRESAWTHPESEDLCISGAGSQDDKKQSVKALIPEYMKKQNAGLLGRWRTQRLGRTKTFDTVSRPPLCSRFRVQKFLASKIAEFLVTMGIFLNAANVGIEADWSVKHPSEATPLTFQVANTCFSVFFTAELLLRIYAWRSEFFSCDSKEFKWNIFDTFLVIAGIIDDAISLIVSTPNFTVIRVLRVFRLVRVIRVVRMLRFFQDLRVIIAGISGAMKSMLWAVALLFMMMFLVSVCLLQLTSFELDRMDAPAREAVLAHYGSLFGSIYTLYQAITGGVDWGDAAKPLLDMSPFLAILFSFYIAFSVICVLNIITGVFVENASSISYADDEQLVIDDFENRVRWFEEVQKLFKSMVGDNGALDSGSFQQLLDDFKVQAIFRKLGIDVHETSKQGLFQILDFDGTGSIDLEEFALGLQMLHGPARSIDLARIRCDLKKVKNAVQEISDSVKAGLPGEEKKHLSRAATHRGIVGMDDIA